MHPLVANCALETKKTIITKLSMRLSHLRNSSLIVRSSGIATLILFNVSFYRSEKVGITWNVVERYSDGCCHWAPAVCMQFSTRTLRMTTKRRKFFASSVKFWDIARRVLLRELDADSVVDAISDVVKRPFDRKVTVQSSCLFPRLFANSSFKHQSLPPSYRPCPVVIISCIEPADLKARNWISIDERRHVNIAR